MEYEEGVWANVIDLVFEDGSFITIFNDITNFKKNENESRKFRQAIDEMTYVIDLWDEEDKLIIANESSRNMWAKQEIRLEKGKDFKEFLEDAASVIPDLDVAAEFNNRKLLTDQSVVEVYIPPPIDKWSLIIDKRLSDGGILSIHTDVTELKKTQKAQQRLIEAINELPMIIELWDEKDEVIFNNKFSKEFNRSLGFELKQGTSFSELARNHAENKILKRQFFESNKHTIFEGLSKFDLIDNETFVEKLVEWRDAIKIDLKLK